MEEIGEEVVMFLKKVKPTGSNITKEDSDSLRRLNTPKTGRHTGRGNMEGSSNVSEKNKTSKKQHDERKKWLPKKTQHTQNILVLPTDKGNATVVMDQEQHNQKIKGVTCKNTKLDTTT